jgi:hypothetical protein
MIPRNHTGEYLIATTADGVAIIHGSPVTLSWVPRDIINNVYNFAGTVTVDSFDSTDDAKRVARERYSVPFEEWRSSDRLPFETNHIGTEVHTPEVDGHKVIRHGARWK